MMQKKKNKKNANKGMRRLLCFTEEAKESSSD